jgi:hypothetical protein
VLELRISLQVPDGHVVALFVSLNFTLQIVENGDWLFGLLLLFELLVLFNYCFSVLQLLLMLGNFFDWELQPSKTFH